MYICENEDLPGDTAFAVHLCVVAAPLAAAVVGDDVAAVADAGHQVAAAGELGVADYWPEAAGQAVQSQG